jgi:GMP synthase-like glutamine amidotransferase
MPRVRRTPPEGRAKRVRLLVVDNNILTESWGARDLAREAARGGATVEVRRAPHEDLPLDPHRFDRVVVSGSMTGILEQAPWISRLEGALRAWIDRGTPLLGVCYGHQLIVRALGGIDHVRRGETPELGWARIERAGESRILRGLPEAFHSFAWHFDEVTRLPAGFRNVARSERCAIQAYEHESKPVFGVQVHPEREMADGERALAERRRREPKHPGYLGVGDGARLHDPRVAETLFRNFLNA